MKPIELARFPSLSQIEDPPGQLFYLGREKSLEHLETLSSNGLSVVGTRDPSPWSLAFTKQFVHQLSGSSSVIVSGFAHGIDSAAHWAALEVGLPTIAILGCGLDVDYPLGQKKLRQAIIENGGCLISEFQAGTPPLGHHFLQRNRFVGQWTRSTFVIEAKQKSGALNTAHWALKQGRELYTVPALPGQVRFAGNQRLLQNRLAKPFWGLSTLLEAQPLPFAANSQADALWARAEELATHEHRLSFESLLDWALQQGWALDHFFKIFQELVHQDRLREDQGKITLNKQAERLSELDPAMVGIHEPCRTHQI